MNRNRVLAIALVLVLAMSAAIADARPKRISTTTITIEDGEEVRDGKVPKQLRRFVERLRKGLAMPAAAATSPDGSVIGAGAWFKGRGPHPLLVRIGPDGKRDRAFTSRAMRIRGVDQLTDVAVAADGRVLATAVGFRKGSFIVRFLPDGQVDRSFGGDGKTRLPFRGQPESLSLAVDPAGGVAVAGAYLPKRLRGASQLNLARLGASGALQPSFGGTGVLLDQARVFNAIGVDVAVLANGRVQAAAGTSRSFHGSSQLQAWAYTADGSPDPAFGQGGTATLPLSQTGPRGRFFEFPSMAHIDPTGRAIAAASGFFSADSTTRLAALTPSGAPDPAFGATGVADIGFSVLNVACLTSAPAGAVLICGDGPGSPQGTAMYRLAPNGIWDRSFGSGGRLPGVARLPHANLGAGIVVTSGGSVAALTPPSGHSPSLSYNLFSPDGTLLAQSAEPKKRRRAGGDR